MEEIQASLYSFPKLGDARLGREVGALRLEKVGNPNMQPGSHGEEKSTS
jgi:hypothetical protein